MLLLGGVDISMALAETSIEIEISPEIEVNIRQYGSDDGKDLLLWLPSESGLLSQEMKQAQQLATMGYSVWFADLLSAWFLPTLASSIEQLPAEEIAVLLEKVRLLSKKKVYLVASGRGALLSLRAARAWQQRYGDQDTLGGVIMISPKLFIETPEPGQPGEFMPIASQTNLPVFIIQPANSPWRWKLDRIVPILEQSGSDVFTWVLPRVRDRFYYRPDASVKEDRLAKKLALLLRSSVDMLTHYNQRRRNITTKVIETPRAEAGKKERLLRAYSGDATPPQLQLKTIQGKNSDLKDYKGKVVLVNFWASWCPPCVHEMPSMQNLSEHFGGQAFEILAVNMAEDKKTVRAFLREKVKVKFPILMDLDGQTLKRWRVFAFPTSYVIDKQGKIRLALFGAIDWMQKEVLQQLAVLIQEK
jgi:thiol-disulfide isomerase/thioredoxin